MLISIFILITDQKCIVDGYVGSYVMIENKSQRIWNFTLEPGEMTSMHRHDFDYSFIAIKPSQLEVTFTSEMDSRVKWKVRTIADLSLKFFPNSSTLL